jgi:peptidyl-dipeptidase Dcp
MTSSPMDTNPLLEPWTGPFEAPPFDRFEPRHFRPAFDAALKQARAEIDSVAADPAPPSFTNTIEALERSGRSLDRIANVFFNLAGPRPMTNCRRSSAQSRRCSRATAARPI